MESLDGVLVADEFPASVLKPLIDRQVPAVSLLIRSDRFPVSQVVGDNPLIGRMAGEHFLERGFRHYACVGPRDALWSKMRMDGFRQAVGAAAASFKEITAPTLPGRMPLNWVCEKRMLGAELSALPRPCALFCVSDPIACSVLDTCLDLGFEVPRDIAIMGVDNDPLYCESVAVPLTSVRHDVESIGYRAAQQLEQLMEKGEAVSEVIPPLGIAVRRSTDHRAVENPVVLAALNFIGEHHARAIGVADVAEAAGAPLRTLQHLFARELRESVVERIMRVRLTKAEELLARSSYSVAEVAARAGFASSEYFHRVFKARRGSTPVAFRKARQSRGRERTVTFDRSWNQEVGGNVSANGEYGDFQGL
jgi:LacI family transcriptional regulator